MGDKGLTTITTKIPLSRFSGFVSIKSWIWSWFTVIPDSKLQPDYVNTAQASWRLYGFLGSISIYIGHLPICYYRQQTSSSVLKTICEVFIYTISGLLKRQHTARLWKCADYWATLHWELRYFLMFWDRLERVLLHWSLYPILCFTFTGQFFS